MATTKAPAAKTRRELRDIAIEMIIGNTEALESQGWHVEEDLTDKEIDVVGDEIVKINQRIRKMLGRA